MSAREPTSLARPVTHWLAWAESRGAKRSELLSAAKLDASSLVNPDGRVPVRSYYELIAASADALRDPLAGLHYMESVGPEALGAIGFLADRSATLGEAFAQIFRFLRVLTQGERFWLEVLGDVAEFGFEPWGPPHPAHAHCAEMYAYDCLVLAARATGGAVPAISFELRHASSGAESEYVRLLGAAPRFRAARNAWSIPASVLARPMLRADAGLTRFLEPQAEALGRALPASTELDDVRAAIVARLASGDVALPALAATLRVSPRTLQRRLADAGTHLRALLEDVRRERALALLARGLSVPEASFLLGFSEPRAFFRAFKRWTGATPGEWRARG